MQVILRFLIDYFPVLLDVSLTAGVVILCVICVRFFLKRAPKIFSYALWGIVLIRLLVPVSVESPISVVPETREISNIVVNQNISENEFEMPKDHTENAWQVEITPPNESLPRKSATIRAQTYLPLVWLLGIAVMVLYSMVSYWKLRKRVSVAIPIQKGIYIADDIAAPFVMGIFHPTIFLPGTLKETERTYIIAHEQHHIRRGDHIFKALGFLALTVHWFNPLVWVAFALAGRDMEMSCDEAVIRKLGAQIRGDYSASLLNLATGHRLFNVTPLAFGEGDPAGRVRNLAKWKKPALWVIVICIVLCSVLGVCLLTDPQTLEHNGNILVKMDGVTPITKAAKIDRDISGKTDIPLEELPQLYSAEEAALDGCFVQHDGVATENKELFREFFTRTQKGEPSYIRIVDWYHSENDSRYFIHDLSYNGSLYTITWLEDGQRHEKQFRYLKFFAGEKERENIAYDAYEHYVLVNDETLTWMNIWEGLISSQYSAHYSKVVDHMTVYSDYLSYPTVVKLPGQLTRAVLEFEDKPLVTVTDSKALAGIFQLFDGAEALDYEPKNRIAGLDLCLILHFAGGGSVNVDLDPYHDICQIDGEFIFYGTYDEPYHYEKLWSYLGITAWPDSVYEKIRTS